ncbi:iron-containing alcohol dehydrogenase [Roseomonas sp. PWR1]|uniref:Iron-containing alcohol dehydrogenase n=1 Tax=Roseomonas nitratireducens TaxID=2820810 RepID=A0ABS4AX29_9PROT|nr:iron-containing alcohol dehydrogenase [Neoroseomonas nitratireducens]MBP0465373.1 iron-containing alcohol dehydrogenase [Neoroseomonas nitratireducens]
MALMVYLNRVQFGFGALAETAEELRLAGIRRPLVVTDAGVRAAGLLDRLLGELPADTAAAVFDATPPNPDEAAVHAAVALYLSSGADGVLALGGGSPLDLAKAVALAATHDAPRLAPYAVVEGGLARITAAAAPIVAVPTTAGTGSEVSRGALIILDDGRKVSIGSPHLIPRAAICAPELTLGLPAGLTAATGMDAMAHCIETLCSARENPIADAIALDGLGRAWRALPRAVENGADRDARKEMMLASMQGALAFQKGLGAVHALSHALGALPVRPHHGTLNALLLPPVLRFNAPEIGGVVPRLAQAVGVAPTADALADAIAALNRRIGLPGSLAAMGVPNESLPAVAAAAMRDHHHQTNPRRAEEGDYLRLLRAAHAGG